MSERDRNEANAKVNNLAHKLAALVQRGGVSRKAAFEEVRGFEESVRDADSLRQLLQKYFAILDTARRVQRASGNLGMDSHMQDLQEAESAVRAALSGGAAEPGG